LSKQPVIDRTGSTGLEYITVFWLLALDCCLRPTGQHYWLMPYILDCRKDLRENSYVLRVFLYFTVLLQQSLNVRDCDC